MLGMNSMTLDGKQLAKAVDMWLKQHLAHFAHDFRVSAVFQPHTYRDEFTVTFEPLEPEDPETETLDT